MSDCLTYIAYISWLDCLPSRHSEATFLLKGLVMAFIDVWSHLLMLPIRPAYMQYGAFGMVAAHELTVCQFSIWVQPTADVEFDKHAFDSAGRLYNQQGKLEPWWTNATSERFDKIQKCISDQYSSPFFPSAFSAFPLNLMI